ncbi:PI-PLC X domain-containing protein 1 isoform X2 [Neolamprologus brichardi]|uniref:PI-PLC X domain-containing protein 1 isoform X2 n=1 Tax=Neolamprologus brichardi TaxID=32507 RepID=UPI001643F2C8|nr:PI-PLC X domain-containing protein 1 isoform X2 [Neolamprologus brichardi]
MSGLSEPSLMELPMESWMSRLPCALWDIPLFHLAIPGSHNAITYCLDMDDRSPIDLMQPDMLQKLDKFMKPLIRPFVYKWAKTQECCIKHQLDCGVRYCDLRIAHRPNDSSTHLYFYHGVYTTLTVEAEVTLRKLWASGYQVIASYEHSTERRHTELWPDIPYWWANKCKAEALIDEFERMKQQNRRPGGFFVTGINLTEDLKYICTHPTESLKDLVMSTYPTLLGWVKEQTPGEEDGSLNIIAGDFVSESRFVPTVVALNQKLLKRSS